MESVAVSSNEEAAGQTRHGWNTIDWAEAQKRVFKLQKRIYRASLEKDVKRVHSLQRLLTSSRQAKLLAVRRVTQDNRGKKTAGVDGTKSLTKDERLSLANNLTLPKKAPPARRVWIDKPNSQDKRPLGIPTIKDRAAQALVKMALEPEWEAKFEPNSYGFRPGRNANDAIQAIFLSANKRLWVLDADIRGCFDNIDHACLLSKLATYTSMRRVIKAWLKAGYVSDDVFCHSDKGTPQGGVISPLLANIALHGMEEHVGPNTYTTNGTRLHPKVVRYADDFGVLAEAEAVEAREKASTWLSAVGLELKDSKTRIAKGSDGFDFLGFTIREFNTTRNHKGFKTIIKPGRKSIVKHMRSIKAALRRMTTTSQLETIAAVKPIVRGWCNYFRGGTSRRAFNACDNTMNHQLRRWVDRKHHAGKRGYRKSAYSKYFRQHRGFKWLFATPDGKFLMLHTDHRIVRHRMVKPDKSPYDGDTVYWAARLGRSMEISPRIAKLLKEQKGKCKACNIMFDHESIMEVHHLDGNHDNEKWNNLMLLHGHCHDNAHSRRAYDKGRVEEEPNEAKVSRSVLEQSSAGRLAVRL